VLGVQIGLAGLSLPPFVKFVIVTVLSAMLSFGISHLVAKIPPVGRVLGVRKVIN
jgi:hypothetical protein